MHTSRAKVKIVGRSWKLWEKRRCKKKWSGNEHGAMFNLAANGILFMRGFKQHAWLEQVSACPGTVGL